MIPTLDVQGSACLETGYGQAPEVSQNSSAEKYERQIALFGNSLITSASYGEHSNKDFKAHATVSNNRTDTRVQQVSLLQPQMSTACALSPRR